MVSDDRPTVPTTVAIPTHPARGRADDPSSLLGRAVASVYAQTWLPGGGLAIALDTDREGAAATRQRALDMVTTEWVSFLDSDDSFYPHHLETHYRLLMDSGADVAYSWFDGVDPFPKHRGRAFDPDNPHHLTMTLTVRTRLAKAVGFTNHPEHHASWSGEDWAFILGLRDMEAEFVGTGEVTWTYFGHNGNSSGVAGRGDA